ncbi:hypothetical protein [Sphaerobacter sp.]|uniref:hypothetical protein n=1 Tax=Sphaerobacter sp. TaxID=2099654 RepID=UPI001D23BFE7|nr:hypothetical protein [Sphaerobacter sp.]MBX5446394.1 hypothetical protein [Sphaerobacter sp.]
MDVTNPGQFFACCGLLEAAHRLWPGAEGWFEGQYFHVACDNAEAEDPLSELIEQVTQCTAEVIPFGGDDAKIAPIRVGPPLDLELDWWLFVRTSPTPFKTWAANASSLQMYTKWIKPLQTAQKHISSDTSQVFEVSTPIQGSYGFDSSVGWNALDVGFSLNEHASLKRLPLRPAVELFGAIGLQRFLPALRARQEEIDYCVWRMPLMAQPAAAVVRGVVTTSFSTRFRCRFVKRGTFKGLSTSTSIGE